MREFEVLKKLNHKNIVKLFAVEEEVGDGDRLDGNHGDSETERLPDLLLLLFLSV